MTPEAINWRRWWRVPALLGAATILLLPLIAMQFTDEVVWDSTDFAVMGAMLLVLLLAVEAITRLMRGKWALAAGGLAVLVFLAVWAELAVGIFD